MDNMEFKLTYSAKEQAEIKKIRDRYAPKEQAIDKMEQLRRLDRIVSDKATLSSLIIGIVGALLLGIGMSCAMVWQGLWFIPGILIGILGIILVSLAYPVYNKTVKRERKKIAPEILKPTDELMK